MKTELALYQALIAINVSESKATAVIEALEADLTTLLVTKADFAALRGELLAQLAQQENKLLLRTGMMLSASTGILIAVLKYL
ncbi:hypothetical protein F477_01806 [Pseudomonas sp. URIL14HWK12:I3]|uniref:hypothetical protein n=1 Tax=unclassified Pseudomonas TaxID=196821 RepID=UPI000DAD56CF|nr:MULTISPECIES: hypothetical protein [unclassified Pseudomonas]PZW50686.1 hypothetical protein F478_03456 [Pseudomonas sp. URIL14HWK12:I2]PZW58458.1 hypothetical protein F477_01806 [Pseudomonas sp. URIL14HWK12:I3]